MHAYGLILDPPTDAAGYPRLPVTVLRRLNIVYDGGVVAVAEDRDTVHAALDLLNDAGVRVHRVVELPTGPDSLPVVR